MAVFKSIITDLGADILTESMALSDELVIDYVVIGDGRYSGDKSGLLNVVSPIEIISKISNREFVPKAGTEPSYLQITVDILNAGLTQSTPVREIGLFSGGIMFAYSWLDGADTDNIMPVSTNPEFSDTMHSYDINLFITSDENKNISISFSLTVADNELVSSMSTRIGQSSDIESATGTTLFSRISYIVRQFVSYWTSARAARIDSIDATVSSRAPASTALSTTNWTNTRAVNIDNLDAMVSSRAPNSTALSNATWTATRATYLDRLDVAISTRAPSSTALSTATWTAARATKIDTIETNVATVNTNVSAVNTNVATVNTNLGAKADAAGVTATSSLFSWVKAGKAVVDNTYTHLTSYLSSARMSKIEAMANVRQISWWTPGTYSWTVPVGVTKISITACAGGGGGSKGGGGGGDCVIKKEYTVTASSVLSVKIGTSGIAGSATTAGGTGGITSIGSLVSLSGGGGGKIDGTGGVAGGTGGGAGGQSIISQATVATILPNAGAGAGASGGTTISNASAGGGGSYGGGGGASGSTTGSGFGGTGLGGTGGAGGISATNISGSGASGTGGAPGGLGLIYGSQSSNGGGGGAYGGGGGSISGLLTSGNGGYGGVGMCIIEW